MCISIPCSDYAAQILYIHKYSLNTLRVKRLVTCPRVFLPLAWHLLEHTAAPSMTVTGISDTDSQHQAALSFLEYLKALGSPELIKRGSCPALVMNMCIHGYIYPNLCICRNTLTFCEKAVNACELWKAFKWNALLRHH